MTTNFQIFLTHFQFSPLFSFLIIFAYVTIFHCILGQPRSALETLKTPITEDYEISQTVLGLGINGKVVQVKSKADGQKYALKVLKDNVKSRREVELHWKSSACKHIVNIKDVYENNQKGQKCLLVVMEW